MKLEINNVSYLKFSKTNGINILTSKYKDIITENYWLNNLMIYER